MPEAAELQPVASSLVIWSAYDSASRVELFSSAIQIDRRLYLVDPIALAPSARRELEARGKICGAFITNVNHLRSAKIFADEGAMLLASASTAMAHHDLEMLAIFPGDRIGGSVEAIAIEGAAEGELAFFVEDDRTMIVGDALIHFDPNGFSLLPAKYCGDQKQMRRSLRQLLDFSFTRMLFAHGEPILSGAKEKLTRLLADR